jgi:hypothetical protein
VLGRIVYWLAVVLISLGLVVALILFLEARDQSQVGAVPLVFGALTTSS